MKHTLVLMRGSRDPIVIKGFTLYALIGIAILLPLTGIVAMIQGIAALYQILRVIWS